MKPTIIEKYEPIDVGSESAEIMDLIARFNAGDLSAFDEIYRMTHKFVLSCALRFGNPEQAEDICQEVYVRVYKHLGKFEGRSNFKSWLYRIVVNTSNTLMSKRRRMTQHEQSVLGDESYSNSLIDHSQLSPESEAEIAELWAKLYSVLPTVSAKMRSVVHMRVVEDMPFIEIANTLGITESAAKVRMHRFRERYGELLNPDASQSDGFALRTKDMNGAGDVINS
jgi:RNA polymerase sigma-70 factor (ECF subfamily)